MTLLAKSNDIFMTGRATIADRNNMMALCFRTVFATDNAHITIALFAFLLRFSVVRISMKC